MTRNELTTQDLQNILACVAMAKVDGVQAAAALVVLHNKLATILQAEKDGNGNGAKSDQPGADQPAAANDHVDAGN